MKKLLLISVAGIALYGCGEASSDAAQKSSKLTPYDQCVENGVEYFKEIQSYPKLSDGRDSENVARDRCRRSLQAFGLVE